MNIKKFEAYNMDYDINDIGDEYAKLIISKFIDEERQDKSLEDVFYEIAISDELEEHQESVKYSMIMYLTKLLSKTKKLKSVEKIGLDKETKKYNL